MVEVVSLTPTQEAVLAALATYRFLSVKQMIRGGVCANKQHLYKVLETLQSVRRTGGKKERRAREIGHLDFGVVPGVGRLDSLYYLTETGAQLLQDAQPDRTDIHVPVRVTRFRKEYFHRVGFVDIHMAMRQWTYTAGQEVRWFRSYFDYTRKRGPEGSVRHTAVRSGNLRLVPDGVFQLQDRAGKRRLFALEFARGKETWHVEDQIRQYCQALTDEVLETNFTPEENQLVRVLFVFDDARGMELVQERVCQLPELAQTELTRQIFFKSMADITHFGANWQRVGESEPVILF